MIQLINKYTGTTMWVADNRVDEYLAAGHKLAAVLTHEPAKPTEEAVKAVVKRQRAKKK